MFRFVLKILAIILVSFVALGSVAVPSLAEVRLIPYKDIAHVGGCKPIELGEYLGGSYKALVSNAYGLDRPGDVVIVYFDGDHIASRKSSGALMKSGTRLYCGTIATFFGSTVDVVIVPRPGTFGQPGDHFRGAYKEEEAGLGNFALDAIKRERGDRVTKFLLVGFSGGGFAAHHAACGRSDVVGIVSTSGVVDTAHMANRGTATRQFIYARPRLDPSKNIDCLDPSVQVIVVADRKDRKVKDGPWRYYQKLVKMGFGATFVKMDAPDQDHHNLKYAGIQIAVEWYKSLTKPVESLTASKTPSLRSDVP